MNNLSVLHPDGSRSSRNPGWVSEGKAANVTKWKTERQEMRMCRTPRQEARESGARSSIFMRACAHDSYSWDMLKCAHAYDVQIVLEVVYFNENMFSEHVACWDGRTSMHARTHTHTIRAEDSTRCWWGCRGDVDHVWHPISTAWSLAALPSNVQQKWTQQKQPFDIPPPSRPLTLLLFYCTVLIFFFSTSSLTWLGLFRQRQELVGTLCVCNWPICQFYIALASVESWKIQCVFNQIYNCNIG